MFCLENNLKLNDNEKVLFIARPGFRYYKFRIVIFVLFVLIPAFFYFFLITQGIHGLLLLTTIPALAILYLARILFIYFYNVYIFTSKRIIGIEQRGLFDRLIMDIKLTSIKEVNLFKNNSLHLVLLDGKNLILDKIDDQEYMFEILLDLIANNKGGNRGIEFSVKQI
ncbi:MAG: PH domain-containing protein [bacterium]